MARGTKSLQSLEVGDIVSVQNQAGPRAKRWDKTGVIVETRDHDQYRVKVDGSGQTTLRNRQFLRKLPRKKVSFSPESTQQGREERSRRHRSGRLSAVQGGGRR